MINITYSIPIYFSIYQSNPFLAEPPPNLLIGLSGFSPATKNQRNKTHHIYFYYYVATNMLIIADNVGLPKKWRMHIDNTFPCIRSNECKADKIHLP